MAHKFPIRPGQSNDPDPGRRILENALIREFRTQSRIRQLGFPTESAKVKALKKRLGFPVR